MVRLRSYYSLCPLIDRKSFLGVSEDSETGCGIITLGRNVVTRYKFSDQKQIGGWTSKDHISAPVIYDVTEKQYVGIFNEHIIKVWSSDTNNLDKLKKNKFSKSILKVIRDQDGKSSLVFKDGDCAALSYAIYARKNLDPVSVVEQDQCITNVAMFLLEEKNYICYVCKRNDQYSILTCELNTDINTPIVETLKIVEIKREELVGGRIIGVTISIGLGETISDDVEPPQVHVLWSDGRLFSNELTKDSFTLVGHVPWICCDVDVSMAWMGGKHLALYGADSAQEGAVLAIFNVLFGVGTCSHPLKLFSKGARLWCLPEYILLEATQHLSVVPFIMSSYRDTLALIGSYKSDKESDQILTADWGKGKSTWKCKDVWNELATKGMSEREICLEYFPPLLEESNIKSIRKSIREFADIPENVIVSLVSFVIKKLGGKNSLEISKIDFNNELSVEKLELQTLLNSLLDLPYVKENIISHLRKNLVFEDMLFLLRYISFLLSDKSENTNYNFDFEQKIILWSSVLIDSHYQQLALSNEEVTGKILSGLVSTIDDLICQVECTESVTPMLLSLCAGKDINQNICIDDSSTYYIEEIKIKGF